MIRSNVQKRCQFRIHLRLYQMQTNKKTFFSLDLLHPQHTYIQPTCKRSPQRIHGTHITRSEKAWNENCSVEIHKRGNSTLTHTHHAHASQIYSDTTLYSPLYHWQADSQKFIRYGTFSEC